MTCFHGISCRSATYQSAIRSLLALSSGALAYILQLQTAFTTIASGVIFRAVLGVSVAVMRLQEGNKYP